MESQARIFVVDAFTIKQSPFTGNPAAVYISNVVRSYFPLRKLFCENITKMV